MKRHLAALIAAATLIGSPAMAAATKPEAAKPPVATATDSVTHDENDRVIEGAAWTQQYFPSSDGSGTELHADVLLPDGLAKGQKVPVILSVGPYFGHSGQKSKEGWTHTGPSNRFYDLIKGTNLLDRGYAFVMVDSRGFGGSTGCLDFAGPDEQADVKAAIAWAAGQPWSTGAVGMYGKSYDAITALIGNNLSQDALRAVVAQEPIWNPYRSPYSHGVPRPHHFLVPGTYSSIASLEQMRDDDNRYRANAAYEKAHPQCLDDNLAGYLIDDEQADHWKARDLPALAKGSDTPLLFTQGFIEDNTKPEDMDEYLANHRGPQRGWLGQWNHVRGNDRTDDGRLEMGRDGWLAETMSFYDQYLKGITPTVTYPTVAVQDNTGTWRAQDTWPVVEKNTTIALGRGTYVDDGGADARAALAEAGLPEPAPNPTPDPDEEGAGAIEPVIPKNLAAVQLKRIQQGRTTSAMFTFSTPVTKATRLTGTPEVSLNTQGKGNVMVKLYDVAPDGKAVIINENVAVLKRERTTFDLKSTDWTLTPGHVLGVEFGAVQTGSWLDRPSRRTISVTDARLKLALDNPDDDIVTEGGPAVFQAQYSERHQVNLTAAVPATFTVPAVPGTN